MWNLLGGFHGITLSIHCRFQCRWWTGQNNKKVNVILPWCILKSLVQIGPDTGPTHPHAGPGKTPSNRERSINGSKKWQIGHKHKCFPLLLLFRPFLRTLWVFTSLTWHQAFTPLSGRMSYTVINKLRYMQTTYGYSGHIFVLENIPSMSLSEMCISSYPISARHLNNIG